MSELNYLETALDGAAFVLTLALEKLPCQLGLVSLFDLDRRQFVVVRQQGGAKSALLLRLADGARLVHAAMKKREPVLASGANVADELDGRWKEIGLTPTTLLCAPVERAGRTLGLIELANPLDGKTFTEGDRHALGYIGQQFAEFLSERSVLVDPDLVLAAAEFDLR
ncbi:MAG: GAF domain-containing protein [Myxococcales bacterium]|nr:GAF domain-containing protein [Myxococcales bacterium]